MTRRPSSFFAERFTKSAIAALSLLGAAACGLPPSGETEGQPVEGAIDQDVCLLSEVSNGTLDTSKPSSSSLSPTLYNHPACGKAWVAVTNGFLPNVVEAGTQFRVLWRDPWLRNKTQCEGAFTSMFVMSKGPGESTYGHDFGVGSTAFWNPNAQRCEYMFVKTSFNLAGIWEVTQQWVANQGATVTSEFTSPAATSLSGRKVKIVASARTPAGTTQPLEIRWTRP